MIKIKQACEDDIQAIEGIMLDAVNWFDSIGKLLWTKEQVSWQSLSWYYRYYRYYRAIIDVIDIIDDIETFAIMS